MSTTELEYPKVRMRRLRQHPRVRDLVREHHLQLTDLVYPLFIRHGRDVQQPVASMPGCAQISVDHLASEIDQLSELGIPAVMLFGIPEHKDAHGSDAYADKGVMQRAIAEIKRVNPEMLVSSDICFCEYTDHGHCGVVNERHGRLDVDNDATLALLAKQVVSHARAGVDMLVPSGMMDGAARVIRRALDNAGYQHLPIMMHAAKLASSFYGPFRDAAEGGMAFGDRRSYQMDPANGQEVLREVALDLQEGADIILVKPAHTCLDLIYRVKQHFPGVPIAAYHVSGEYAMIKAAAANGWLDERQVALEVLTAIKRAGADIIVSYFAKDVAKWLSD